MALLCCIVIIITAGQLKKYQFRAQGLVTFPCVCHKQWHLILNVPEIHQSTNASIPVIYMLHSRASTIAQAIGRTLVIQQSEIYFISYQAYEKRVISTSGTVKDCELKELFNVPKCVTGRMFWKGKKDHWNRFCLFIFYTRYSVSPPRQIKWYCKIWKHMYQTKGVQPRYL